MKKVAIHQYSLKIMAMIRAKFSSKKLPSPIYIQIRNNSIQFANYLIKSTRGRFPFGGRRNFETSALRKNHNNYYITQTHINGGQSRKFFDH